ncbi:MAG: ACT domain-containing protein [Chitinispirillaceae bacterium]
MNTKQISVFLENKKGRLASVSKVLRDNKLNIRALTIADTEEFGIVRMILSEPDRAYQVLKKEGFTVKENTIVAVEIDDREGLFYDLTKLCDDNDLNIEYTYSFVEQSSNKAILFLRFDDADAATKVLQDKGYEILSDEQVRKI